MNSPQRLSGEARSKVFNGFSDGRPLYLEIDRSAFLHNLVSLEALSQGAKLMPVLKANAYGHGLLEMAALVGDRDIAVAVPEEMKLLRNASIENRIWVLEGPFGDSCLDNAGSVVWVVHSLWQLELLTGKSPEKDYLLCLKLNTGMNRLGLDDDDFSRAVGMIENTPNLKLYACMTHFASSDCPEVESVNVQMNAFNLAVDAVAGSDVLRTCANSGGLLFYPQSHQDLVRPGISLFGALPSPGMSELSFGLKPVMKFKSAVIAIQEVPEGQGVGYGARWVAKRDSRIAIVAGGYGDGYPRHANDGTPIAIYDEAARQYCRLPLAGRVSMDMLAVDVTDMSSCEVGASVELWGEHVASDEVALAADTISYELYCSITRRVPRVYVDAS